MGRDCPCPVPVQRNLRRLLPGNWHRNIRRRIGVKRGAIMKLRILNYEETQMNFFMFLVSIAVPVAAFIFVMLFLQGTAVDAIVLLMAVSGILIKTFEKKLGRYAKYLYISIMPFWGAFVIIIAADGKFVAMTQAYFLWLFLGIAYYDVSVVRVCVVVTLLTNCVAMSLFPAAYLKLHSSFVWAFIFIVYALAVIAAYAITSRTYHILGMEEQLKNYENDLVYLQALQKKDEKYGIFIHNMTHYLMAIGELAKDKNYESILGLLKELSVELENNERIIYTTHKVVNAILSEKKAEAEGQEIRFDAYVEQGCTFGMVSDGDLAAMFGNLLDNAVRAAGNCMEGEREVVVRVYMENQGRICVAKIVNAYSEKLIRTRSGFASTKKDRGMHGIGIKSVEKTAGKYGGYLECMAENNIFTSVLVLPVETYKKYP